MSTVGARLKNDGTLLTAGVFDEVTQSTHSIKIDGIFAAELDEHTISVGSAPGGAAELNGTTQYLGLASSPNFQFGTADFTVEGYFFLKALSYTRLWSFPNGDNVEVQDSTIYYWNGATASASSAGVISQDQWIHVALVKRSGVVNLYVDGVSRITDNSPLDSSAARALAIGGEVSTEVGGQNPTAGTRDGFLNGYITNFRVVKGTAVYTTDFNVSNVTPLTTVVSDTVLLLVMEQSSNFLADSSASKMPVTNVGGVTFKAATPFSMSTDTPMKQYSNGILQVKNEFDEVTGIV
jgi:hypothetical protein